MLFFGSPVEGGLHVFISTRALSVDLLVSKEGTSAEGERMVKTEEWHQD